MFFLSLLAFPAPARYHTHNDNINTVYNTVAQHSNFVAEVLVIIRNIIKEQFSPLLVGINHFKVIAYTGGDGPGGVLAGRPHLTWSSPASGHL